MDWKIAEATRILNESTIELCGKFATVEDLLDHTPVLMEYGIESTTLQEQRDYVLEITVENNTVLAMTIAHGHPEFVCCHIRPDILAKFKEPVVTCEVVDVGGSSYMVMLVAELTYFITQQPIK